MPQPIPVSHKKILPRSGKPRAVALMSGGLDSTLAAKLIKDQGVEVIGLHFTSPFSCRPEIEKNAKAIGVPLVRREKGEGYLNLLKKPKYGYGKAVNPCIDCRIYMFELAEEELELQQADFVVTGEVLGQRPMSQRRDAFHIIDRDSETKGLILRPLSAHLFPPTVAEEQGWVDRAKLLGIVGRSRKQQLALAKAWGITDFDPPGGGCLLTKTQFGPRLNDFFAHEETQIEEGDTRMTQVELLTCGRQFRITDNVKLVVGRNEKDNLQLIQKWRAAKGALLSPLNFAGPNAIILGDAKEKELKVICSILVRYGKTDLKKEWKINYESSSLQKTLLASDPIDEKELEALRI